MNNLLFYDTETLGLTGPAVLIQSGRYEGPVDLFYPWDNRVSDTLNHIEWMLEQILVAWHNGFDHFHLQQLHNIFLILKEEYGDDFIPSRHFHNPEFLAHLVNIEEEAIDGPCIKPAGVLDLMLYAIKGPYQKCMPRKEVRIYKVPERAVNDLVDLLNSRLVYDKMLFGGRKTKDMPQWSHSPSKDKRKQKIDGFRDVFCKFNPTKQLKAVAEDLGIIDEAKYHEDYGVPMEYMPVELNFAPFAKAIIDMGDEEPFVRNFLKNKVKNLDKKLEMPNRGTWVDFIAHHNNHWKGEDAKEYATDDVTHLRAIYDRFGRPEPNDNDSSLTCCVASSRWKGFAIDIPKLKELREKQQPDINKCVDENGRLIVNETKAISRILRSKIKDPDRLKEIAGRTDDATLNQVMKWGGEAGKFAKMVDKARSAKKMADLCTKLIIGKRYHPDFNIVGAFTNRMSGTSDLNAQGINKGGGIRECFPLAFEGETFCGGDFDSFEVAIFQAVSQDQKLLHQLLNDHKIHGVFGSWAYDKTYEEVCADTAGMYKRAKAGVFLIIYGGREHTLAKTLNVSVEKAIYCINKLKEEYPGIGKELEGIERDYTAFAPKDDGGFKTVECPTTVESLYGHKRSYEIDLQTIYGIYNLINTMPSYWQDKYNRIVIRSGDREQSEYGALLSSLFGTCFVTQRKIQSTAGNHKIQSTGAEACKKLQARQWALQPVGVHPWKIRVVQVHDEVHAVCSDLETVWNSVETTEEVLEDIRQTVPLADMTWEVGLNNWSEI